MNCSPLVIQYTILSNKRGAVHGEYSYKDVVIPDGIPAIVDRDTFERVQERLTLNSRAPARKKANEEYLLSMKLFCGDCGRLMVGESGTSSTKGVVHQYYKCGGTKRHLGCKRKAVKKHWIEDAVIIQTVSRVLKDKEIDRLADRIIELQGQEDTTIPAMQRQLQECEKGIENMLNAIQMGILTSSTKDRLEQLEAQRDELKTTILQAQLERPKYTKEQIISWISRFKYGNPSDPEYRR